MRLVGHILDHILDHLLDHMLNQIIIGSVTMALNVPNNKYIKHKLKLENDIAKIARKKFLI